MANKYHLVDERGKHNHENTLEDVEIENDDEEVNDDENDAMTEEQIQQQLEQSTSAAAILENNAQIQCQQNYGLEVEEDDYQDLGQFKLAIEPISEGACDFANL